MRTRTSVVPAATCIGLVAGTFAGTVSNNPGLWVFLGLSVGLCAGLLIDLFSNATLWLMRASRAVSL